MPDREKIMAQLESMRDYHRSAGNNITADIASDALNLLKKQEGHWVEATPDGIVSYAVGYAECSVCHRKSWLGCNDEYCRHCGAKMS